MQHEPAYLLHRYDWSETSLILDLFTRGQGRVVVAAKGAKRPYSQLRAVLLPLQRLNVSYGSRRSRAAGAEDGQGAAEVQPLKAAEWAGGTAMPGGAALLTGLYLNELLMKLLARQDPHPVLFDAYAQTLPALSGGDDLQLEAALRAFELVLLREIGLLPVLDVQTSTLAPLQPDQTYILRPEAGLVEIGHEDRGALAGGDWLSLQAALDEPETFEAVLPLTAEMLAALKPQLRALLHYHCGVSVLRTRQMMLDLQSL